MSEDKKDVPSKEGQTSEPSSEGTDSGSDTKTDSTAPSIPEHLEGKSAEELIQMQKGLEKKLGEQSSEVAEARESKKNIEVLLQSIYSDPKRFQTARTWINDYLGLDNSQEKNDSLEGDDSGKTRTQTATSDDTRRALQNQAFGDFYGKTGITHLDESDRKKEQQKIAQSLADIADPSGTKSMKDILDNIPVDKLPKYLDAAYALANPGKVAEGGKLQGLMTAHENRQATIGSLSSSSSDTGTQPLSAAEKKVAENLGVSVEDYAKSKVVINKP